MRKTAVAILCLMAAFVYFANRHDTLEAARLADLKLSNPKAYFDEIARTDFELWKREIATVAPENKKSFVERAINAEKVKLSAAALSDHEARKASFTRLLALDPSNDSYRINMLNEGAAQVRAKRAAHMTTLDYGEGVLLTNFSWSKGGFNTILVANFTLKNLNDLQVRDMEVVCEVMAPSGTTVSRPRTTVYEIIPAGKSKVFKEISVGLIHSQASGASCDVSRARPD